MLQILPIVDGGLPINATVGTVQTLNGAEPTVQQGGPCDCFTL